MMRKLAWLLVVLIPSGFVRAEDAVAIVEKAIAAHGGADKLARLKAMRAKAEGTIHFGADAPFILETIWQWPNRLQNRLTLTAGKNKTVFVETISGDDNWVSSDGKVALQSDAKLDELRAQTHVRRLLLLTPLLHDKSYKLSVLDEIQIDDRQAVGVVVACAGERDVKLYFDKETGRLAKVVRHVYNESRRKEELQEEFYRDYKDIDGVPTARKQITRRDGKKASEMTFSEVRYPKGIADAAFTESRSFTRQRDVIYGRRPGVSLTMDVFSPKKKANGAAIIVIVSGGYYSNRKQIDTPFFMGFIEAPAQRGYKVFAVVHGSQPRYTIPDAIADVHRAVRFIRYHARDYHIDPDRIGVLGASAGGHLSLMLGVTGDKGDSKSHDAVERTSSRVQAVACFFPPTDYFNFGGEGKRAFAKDGRLAILRAVFDVRVLDKKSKRLERLTDKDKIDSLYRKISPITHVDAGDAPTLMIHGDADQLVPLHQSEKMVAKLKEAGVPAKLLVRKGKHHVWLDLDEDTVEIGKWFDKYLR